MNLTIRRTDITYFLSKLKKNEKCILKSVKTLNIEAANPSGLEILNKCLFPNLRHITITFSNESIKEYNATLFNFSNIKYLRSITIATEGY